MSLGAASLNEAAVTSRLCRVNSARFLSNRLQNLGNFVPTAVLQC